MIKIAIVVPNMSEFDRLILKVPSAKSKDFIYTPILRFEDLRGRYDAFVRLSNLASIQQEAIADLWGSRTKEITEECLLYVEPNILKIFFQDK